MVLRLSFGIEDFSVTNLYKGLLEWENNNTSMNVLKWKIS